MGSAEKEKDGGGGRRTAALVKGSEPPPSSLAPYFPAIARVVSVGASGSGKSSALLGHLFLSPKSPWRLKGEGSKLTGGRLIWVAPTTSQGVVRRAAEKLGRSFVPVAADTLSPPVTALVDKLIDEDHAAGLLSFVLVDDMGAALDKAAAAWLMGLFFHGRHRGASVGVLLQKLKDGTPERRAMIEGATHLFVHGVPARAVRGVLEEVADTADELEAALEAYREARANRFGFLLVSRLPEDAAAGRTYRNSTIVDDFGEPP